METVKLGDRCERNGERDRRMERLRKARGLREGLTKRRKKN